MVGGLLVTIGILSHNRREQLGRVLEAIEASDYLDHEIMVVDNDSTDGTLKYVARAHSQVSLIGLSDNPGVSSRNIFLERATGKYIFQFDDDSFPADGSMLTKVVSYLEEHPDVDAVCTNIVNYFDHTSETAGWERFAVGGTNESGFEGFFVHAAGMVFRTDSIRRTSGYPVDFFWGLEEADLTLQMVRAGLRCVYKPEFITYHLKEPEAPVRRAWALELKARNVIWVFWKFFPAPLAAGMTLKYAVIQAGLGFFRPWSLAPTIRGIVNGLRGVRRRRAQALLSAEQVAATLNWRRHFWHQLFWKKMAKKGRGFLERLPWLRLKAPDKAGSN